MLRNEQIEFHSLINSITEETELSMVVDEWSSRIEAVKYLFVQWIIKKGVNYKCKAEALSIF